MWGSDYPHHEASSPYTRESLRLSFCDFAEVDMRKLLAETAARVYGFDLAMLAADAARFGPTVAELQAPLDAIPADATSPAFASGIRQR
jgi:hypothetical protein